MLSFAERTGSGVVIVVWSLATSGSFVQIYKDYKNTRVCKVRHQMAIETAISCLHIIAIFYNTHQHKPE
jgi:hypothetical protein